MLATSRSRPSFLRQTGQVALRFQLSEKRLVQNLRVTYKGLISPLGGRLLVSDLREVPVDCLRRAFQLRHDSGNVGWARLPSFRIGRER